MPFEQVKDVIERAKAFHRQLAERLHQCEKEADREKLRMVLDYLAGHEERMEQRLAQIEAATASQILATWYQYPPAPEVVERLAKIEVRPGMSPSDLVCAALQLDEQLLKLYRAAADAAPTPVVREMFESLLEEAKQERAQLVFGLFQPDV